MNLNKHLSFFDPFKKVDDAVHIIGCGALGSYTAVQLAKLGVQKLHLWDFDVVEEKNITNQAFNLLHVNLEKTSALEDMCTEVNPTIKIIKHGKYTSQMLKGYVFLTVDSIEVRHAFYVANQYNTALKLTIDERIALTSGQVYTTDWSDAKAVENIIETSNFKDDEVEVEVSACGTSLSVSPSVLQTILTGISSFINFLNTGQTPKFITFDSFSFKQSVQ